MNIRTLAFVCWLTALTCVLPHTASAMLPIPGDRSNGFVIGVHRIVIVADTRLDASLLVSPNPPPAVDYAAIEQRIVQQLKTTLPKSLTSEITIQPLSATPQLADIEADDTLLVKFSFGYRAASLADRTLLLGAVYPTIERAPPERLRSARTSGFEEGFTGAIPPVPFVLSDAGHTLVSERDNAVRKCTGFVIDWLNHMPFQPSAQTKSPRNTSAN